MGSAVVRFGAAALLLSPAPFVVATVGEAAERTAPPSTTASVDLDAALDSFIADEHGGVVALAVRDGVTTTAAAGVANADGEPMTPAAGFRVASLTKVFVATIVMQLVDEGRVDLDEPLSTYLPDTPVGGDVTIRDLLRHRSGLPNYTDIEDFITDTLADRTRVFTPDDVLAYIADVPPGESDQEFAYSNTNYILLGQLIEELEAADLAAVLDDRISGPAGLDATHLAVAGTPAIEGLAGGWHPDVLDGDPAAAYDSIASGAWAAGAIVSTASELRTFLEALLGGELMSADALAAMTTTDPDDYGLGIGLLELESGTRLLGHEGGIPGYLSFMAIDPISGDICVVLTNNTELPLSELTEQILADW